MGISLTHEEKVAVLDLGGDENRFSPSFLDEFDAHLDDVVGTGAMLALAHDFRVMRADRGYFCKDPGTLGAIKHTMLGPAVRALTASNQEPQSN